MLVSKAEAWGFCTA